jgi:hypothetical protein
MPLAEQAQFLAHCGGGISDLVDRAPQFILGDAKMPGPVLHLMRLAHGDMASVAAAFVKQMVTHCRWSRLQSFEQERPRLGAAAGGSAERYFVAVSLVVHEQRKKQNDRKRNSD